MKEREELMQVEASALDRAVEAMARELYDRQRLLAALSENYLPAWDQMVDEITREHFLQPARNAIQAADDLLRQHYWGEFRERLLGDEAFEVAITAICRPGTAGGMIGRTQSVLAALAALDTTTQQEGQ